MAPNTSITYFLLSAITIVVIWKKVTYFRTKQRIKKLSTVFPQKCTLKIIIDMHDEIVSLLKGGNVPPCFYKNSPKALKQHFSTSVDIAPKTLGYMFSDLETHLKKYPWLTQIILDFADQASLRKSFKSRVFHYPKKEINGDLKTLSDLLETAGPSYEETLQQNAALVKGKISYNPQPLKKALVWN